MSDWTVYFDVGLMSHIPLHVPDEVGDMDEKLAVETFHAWLRHLNEDGSEPEDWDGWLTIEYCERGGSPRPLRFRSSEVKTFEVVEGAPLANAKWFRPQSYDMVSWKRSCLFSWVPDGKRTRG